MAEWKHKNPLNTICSGEGPELEVGNSSKNGDFPTVIEKYMSPLKSLKHSQMAS